MLNPDEVFGDNDGNEAGAEAPPATDQTQNGARNKDSLQTGTRSRTS